MQRPLGRPSDIISELLGSYAGAIVLTKWLQQTRFYEDIYPQAPLAE
jgi:hypothetical protein